MKFVRTALWLGVSVAMFGCSASPEARAPRGGNDNSETGMAAPRPDDYLKPAVSRAAAAMIADLPEAPVVKNSPNQLVLALPPSLDHDSTVPDGSAQDAMLSLRSMLADNEKLKNNFVLISSADVAPNQTTRSTHIGSGEDSMHHTVITSHATKYDPASIYLLTGKFEVVSDSSGGQREGKLTIHVENMQSRRELYQKEIDIRLQWDEQNHRWAPAP